MRQKKYLFCFILICIQFLMILPNKSISIDTYDNQIISNLNLNAFEDDDFSVSFTGMKVLQSGYIAYIAFEDRKSEFVFSMINDYSTIREEQYHLRLIDFIPDIQYVNFTMKQFREVETDNGSIIVDNYEVTNEILEFSNETNFSWLKFDFQLRPVKKIDTVEIEIQVNEISRFVWKFYHKTREENLQAKIQTIKERMYENMIWGILSIGSFAMMSTIGYVIAKRAKYISGIPESLSYLIVALLSSSWTLAIELFENFRFTIVMFYSAIIFLGLLYGMKLWKGDFRRFKVHQYNKKTNNHDYETLKIYKATVSFKTVDCVLLDENNSSRPLWQSFKRFIGIHQELVLDIEKGETANETYSDKNFGVITTGKYLDAEDVGALPNRKYEVKVTPEMLKHSRYIFDKHRKIEDLEIRYVSEMKRSNAMLGKLRQSFRLQIGQILEGVFETIGEEYYISVGEKISDEILTSLDLTKEDLEKERQKPKSKRKNWVDKLKVWER